MFYDDDLDVCPNCRREIVPDMVCTTCGRGLEGVHDSGGNVNETEETAGDSKR